MFKLLKEKCDESGYKITDFWKDDKKLTGDLYKIYRQIIKIVNWKGHKLDLLKRIRRIGKNSTFSARETKLLRKLANQQRRKGCIDFESIVYFFPGKTVEMLEQKYFNKTSYK